MHDIQKAYLCRLDSCSKLVGLCDNFCLFALQGYVSVWAQQAYNGAAVLCVKHILHNILFEEQTGERKLLYISKISKRYIWICYGHQLSTGIIAQNKIRIRAMQLLY